MYNEYDEYLDELLEEAYLEGYYDSIDDYDDYMERKSTVHPAYLRDTNYSIWRSKMYPNRQKIEKKLANKYKDKDTLAKYATAYDNLWQNKVRAYIDRDREDKKYVSNKRGIDPLDVSSKSRHQFPSRTGL